MQLRMIGEHYFLLDAPHPQCSTSNGFICEVNLYVPEVLLYALLILSQRKQTHPVFGVCF